jgi:four helix bundle protein
VKYSELLVWQKAMDLVTEIYTLARAFPHEERFGLASQLQRAAVSIPANIAEGHGRKSTGAYLNHVSISNGSLMEVETLIQIASRLGYLTPQQETGVLDRTDEIGKMLSGLQRSLNPRSSILDPAP